MRRRLILLLMLIFVSVLLPAALPEGSWIYRSDDTWNYAEVLTYYGEGRACRIEREVGSDGYITQFYQVGELSLQGGQLVFTSPKSHIFFEGADGYAQMVEDLPVRISLGTVSSPSEQAVRIGGRDFICSKHSIAQIFSDDRRIAEEAVPFFNLTVFAMQSQIEGFGTDDMLAYWKNPARIPGGSGSVHVSMESSGTVMFVFPRLPVRLHMHFQDYSIVHGITISGKQTTFSRNRRGDGYLYGDLEIQGICRLIYGDEDGNNAITIADGTIAGGYLQLLTPDRREFLIPAGLQ